MLGLNQPLLINILGHAAGALIFAIFLFLLYSGRGWSGMQGRYLSGLAAGLCLVWNLGSLVVLAWPTLPPRVLDIVVAVSFSMLSLLPAVLLQVSLEGDWPALVAAGYALSTTAVFMHFWEIQGNGAKLHQTALMVITVGFLILAVVAVAAPALRKRRAAYIRRSMCLWPCLVDALRQRARPRRSSELVAAKPLAPSSCCKTTVAAGWIRALPDQRAADGDSYPPGYRSGLAAGAGGTHRTTTPAGSAAIDQHLSVPGFFRMAAQPGPGMAHTRDLPPRQRGGPRQQRQGLPCIRERRSVSGVGRGIDRGGREDEGLCGGGAERVGAWGRLARSHSGQPAAGGALVAEMELGGGRRTSEARPGRCAVDPAGTPPRRVRYFSEDLEVLRRTGMEIGERVEALRRQEMNRLVNQAELRALQSQINPHFLFNALNTLYGTIPREAGGARRMVINLADIFRYFLQSDRTFVPLAQEMQIVRAYLEVEQLRLGDRLGVEFHVDEAALGLLVPVLSVQPLVENAIKHGIAQSAEPGYVHVRIELRSEELRITVENSSSAATVEEAGAGVGLQNVRRRLEICYGPGATLRLAPDPEKTTAEICIPLSAR